MNLIGKKSKEKKPKEKKTKEKKPREKKVRVKKPKKEKPKKEKKVKPPKAKKVKEEKKDGGQKKGGKKKLLFIIIPVLAVAVAASVFFIKSRNKEDVPDTAAVDETEQDGENGEGSGEEEEEEKTEEIEDGNDVDEEGVQPLSVSQAVNYVMTLPPSLLGLSGASMADYQIYPGGAVVRVDGMACTQLSVYSTTEKAGTNDIVGTYLLSRGEVRHLFKLDKATKQVTEIPLPDTEPTEEAAGEETGSEE